MQTLHYLTLSIIVPPLLAIFSEPSSLIYQGGAANVGMIMDWREMAGRPTVRHGGIPGEQRWSLYGSAWSGGKQVGVGLDAGHMSEGMDATRGWIIALCWLAACCADVYYLYALVRRPRLILDFAITLMFNHLVLTTYYSASIPTSLFFWLIMVAGSAWIIIAAEQLCVKREMNEGLVVSQSQPRDGDLDEMEMGDTRLD